LTLLGIATIHHPAQEQYCAVSDTLLTDSSSPELQATSSFLSRVLNGNSVLGRRLLYGSDWEMVGQAAGGADYARRLTRNVLNLFPGSSMENFRWRNAARFLGLGPADKTRARLARFMESVGADMAVLAAFDPSAPAAS